MISPVRVITHCERKSAGYSAGDLVKPQSTQEVIHLVTRKRGSAQTNEVVGA